MHVLARVIDKLLFAALFIAALQVPILADHYRQYLAGYFDATREQVTELESLARQFNYPSVDALIESLKQNAEAVVREDAANKSDLLVRLAEADEGLTTLNNGNYFQQAGYMFAPSRQDTLARVLDNFAPSIPLTPTAIVFSLATAILINLLIICPFWACRHGYHWYRERKQRIRFG